MQLLLPRDRARRSQRRHAGHQAERQTFPYLPAQRKHGHSASSPRSALRASKGAIPIPRNRSALPPADERLIRGLHTRKRRAENHLFLVEGVRIAEEALDADLVLRFAVVSSSLEDNERGAALDRRLRAATAVFEAGDAAMKRLAATETSQGVLLVAETPVAALEDLVLPARTVALVLDGVQDPGNFGTLVRSADAFAAAAVIALPGTVDPWNPKAVRAAAGSLFRVPVARLELPAASAWLRQRGFMLLAADPAGEALDDVPIPERAA
ncbi:MAG: TrmH family RNA methyltransferase, partial [Longimicrobiales bacterium]